MKNEQLAALTAGYRTGAQAASTTLGLAIVASQVATWGDVQAQLVSFGVALGSAAIVGVSSGLVAYLQVLSKGVPDAYQTASNTLPE